jgi:hypothetical protein
MKTWFGLLAGALITVLTLFGGRLAGVVAGFLAGSALWGLLMGGLATAKEPRRMALAGMLGFAPITLTLAILLRLLESVAVRQLGAPHLIAPARQAGGV